MRSLPPVLFDILLIALLICVPVQADAPPEVVDELESALREDPPPEVVAPIDLPMTREWQPTHWLLRRYTLTEETSPLKQVPATSDASGKTWLELPLKYDDARDFFMTVDEELFGWDQVTLYLRLPDDLPEKTDFYFFVKDWDDLWLHIQHQSGVVQDDGTVAFALPLSGKAAQTAWTPRGHFRPWHQLWPGRLKELGVKLSNASGSQSTYEGKAYLTRIELSRSPSELAEAPRVLNLTRNTPTPQVGKEVEYSFQLTHRFQHPYDRSDVDLIATILTPNKEIVTSRIFYMEDFVYDGKPYAGRMLIASGAPQFVLRYLPRLPGKYQVQIGGTVHGQTVDLPSLMFEAAPAAPDWEGFVVKTPDDDRLLVHSLSQREFAGLGMNVRSPYDTRYVASFPFTDWPYTDLDIYEKLMREYAANGINVMEVWMSPWWLALEWMPDAPGNHGVGQMNQWRAWKLDHLVKLAEELNIYLILVLNNHGKFSAWIDSDWARNPYNVKQGGFLETPMQYFSDPRAKQAFQRLADYLVARWGYSPNVLAWKLFTEIDLTGDSRQWYKDPSVTNWHKFAAAYLHEIDPNPHLVTTHWATSYGMVNNELAQLPELDILTLDIYYQGTGSKKFFDYLFATSDFVDKMQKPAIITEFGGSPHGDSLPYILKQLHMAQWLGYFTRFPVAPCFWWFPLVEEKNLYNEYAAASRFIAGESRLGATASHRALADGLYLCELRQPDRRLYYVLDTDYYFANSLTMKPRHFADQVLNVEDLPPGKWQVEYWYGRQGKRMEPARPVEVEDGKAVLTMPEFTHDIAIKLYQTSLETDDGDDQLPQD